MKPRDITQLIRIGAWLHLVTVVLIFSKWAGFLPVTWIMVFLPSLLYGTLILIVGGWTLLGQGHPMSRRRLPVMASSR
jgi:hypothetical protein